MALVNCPECQKEISDKVKNCPHCGYPFDEKNDSMNEEDTNTQTEAQTLPEKTQKSKKIALLIGAGVLIVAAAIIAFVLVGQENERKQQAEIRTSYIANLSSVRTSMLIGAAQAESLCNLTQAVWSDTIFSELNEETYKYTLKADVYDPDQAYAYYIGYIGRDSDKFNNDFNVSLVALYSDSSTIEAVSKIEQSQKTVDTEMKLLQTPPEDLVNCYEVLEDMFTAFNRMTKLATSPSGSLSSFSEDFREYDTDFMEQYEKLGRLIPEA